MNLAFKALADPTRREILQLLRSGNLNAGEIADHFAMTKPSISHHLKLLKQADLIMDEKQGQFIVYTLNTSVVEDAMGWILRLTHTGEGGDKK
ncbi:MAG: autorepressor SdpR family transcription factor [Culicoidibacterales bacterium]